MKRKKKSEYAYSKKLEKRRDALKKQRLKTQDSHPQTIYDAILRSKPTTSMGMMRSAAGASGQRRPSSSSYFGVSKTPGKSLINKKRLQYASSKSRSSPHLLKKSTLHKQRKFGRYGMKKNTQKGNLVKSKGRMHSEEDNNNNLSPMKDMDEEMYQGDNNNMYRNDDNEYDSRKYEIEQIEEENYLNSKQIEEESKRLRDEIKNLDGEIEKYETKQISSPIVFNMKSRKYSNGSGYNSYNNNKSNKYTTSITSFGNIDDDDERNRNRNIIGSPMNSSTDLNVASTTRKLFKMTLDRLDEYSSSGLGLSNNNNNSGLKSKYSNDDRKREENEFGEKLKKNYDYLTHQSLLDSNVNSSSLGNGLGNQGEMKKLIKENFELRENLQSMNSKNNELKMKIKMLINNYKLLESNMEKVEKEKADLEKLLKFSTTSKTPNESEGNKKRRVKKKSSLINTSSLNGCVEVDVNVDHTSNELIVSLENGDLPIDSYLKELEYSEKFSE